MLAMAGVQGGRGDQPAIGRTRQREPPAQAAIKSSHPGCLILGWLYSRPTPPTCASPDRMDTRMLRLVLKCCSRWMNCSRSSAAMWQHRGKSDAGIECIRQRAVAREDLNVASRNEAPAAGAAAPDLPLCTSATQPSTRSSSSSGWPNRSITPACMPHVSKAGCRKGVPADCCLPCSAALLRADATTTPTTTNIHQVLGKSAPCLPALRATLMTAGTLRLRRLMRPSTPSAAGTCKGGGGQAVAGAVCGQVAGAHSQQQPNTKAGLQLHTTPEQGQHSAGSSCSRAVTCLWEHEGDAGEDHQVLRPSGQRRHGALQQIIGGL